MGTGHHLDPGDRAVMQEVGLWARQAVRVGATAALSARVQLREEYVRRSVDDLIDCC